MAKLPDAFVKAPAPKRRGGKTTMVAAEPAAVPVPDVHDVMLRLTDDELRALLEAREELRRAGEELTLAEMVHRVITDWTKRNTMTAPASATPAASAAATAEARMESILDRLRAVARAARDTVRSWVPLREALRVRS